jgi:flagellar hook protein FlgE
MTAASGIIYVNNRKEDNTMVKSMNAAIAGLKAHQTRLDVLGNNIANVNTWGYKSRTTNFQDSLYSSIISGQSGRATTGALGGINTSQLGYGAIVSSISTNFSASNGQYTGNGLDCMIEGGGFFIVGPYGAPINNADGDNTNGINLVTNDSTTGVYLSRVGIFSPDANGYLVDDSGNYVYGYALGEPDENGVAPALVEQGLQPIRVPVDPDTNEPYRIQTWRIGSDGTVTGVDENSENHYIGKIAIASVENPNGLEQMNGYYYKVGRNAGRCYGMESTAAVGTVKSNFLEMSNTDLAFDFATMITTQRGYQANTKIITVTDEILEQLVNMKR